MSDEQRLRIERRSVLDRITSNGTISACVMILAAVAAVICANTDAYYALHEWFALPVSIGIAGWEFSFSFELFVNDFLMAIFFLLVGTELKYEMTVGELRRPRQAMLPMLAAVGGVIAPACIYAFVNRGGAVYGWAIPMATDIAFALGVLSLLGNRVPPAIKVFFSTLAIADDLLAIVAIALFYGHAPSMMWLGAAAVVTALLVVLNIRRHFRLAPYLALGLVLWFCLYQSGVHATLAGVILAFTIPARSDIDAGGLVEWVRAKLPELDDRYDDEAHILGQHDFTHAVNGVERVMHRVTPPLQRLEHAISTPVNFIILPIFAFVNAQVRLVGVDPATLLFDPVALGVYFGMLLGKPIGIVGMTALLVKTKLAELPTGVHWPHVVGVGILGGIGFTMSILIAGLAFTEIPAELLAAKTAILAGSISAALIGLIYMHCVCHKRA
ncbi:Na+/H+ antiporter NhaA [Collinsella ihumii]|uniref:Na(+)/H(+) antiporter NhaA n=2 Tax=Collinsella ihumii TaxID=1720204 RepID=A0ABT7XE44_9ACTN|nr:Na+/H+ antiporter NhaA [Collinsella ihumii]MDN0063686.1 Na+/H+ antiporter NhaA [Collinsella ihumii]